MEPKYKRGEIVYTSDSMIDVPVGSEAIILYSTVFTSQGLGNVEYKIQIVSTGIIRYCRETSLLAKNNTRERILNIYFHKEDTGLVEKIVKLIKSGSNTLLLTNILFVSKDTKLPRWSLQILHLNDKNGATRLEYKKLL